MTVPTDEIEAVRRALAPLIAAAPIAPELEDIAAHQLPATRQRRPPKAVVIFVASFVSVLAVGALSFALLTGGGDGADDSAGVVGTQPVQTTAQEPNLTTSDPETTAGVIEIPRVGFPGASVPPITVISTSWGEVSVGENRAGPCCMAVLSDGRIAVADRAGRRVVVLSAEGGVATLGDLDGLVPEGITVGAEDIVFVVASSEGNTFDLFILKEGSGVVNRSPTMIELPDSARVNGPVPALGPPDLIISMGLVWAGEPTPAGIRWRPIATESGNVLPPNEQVPQPQLPLANGHALEVTLTTVVITQPDGSRVAWALPSNLNVDMVQPFANGVYVAGRTLWADDGVTNNLLLYLATDGTFDGYTFTGSRWAEGGTWDNRLIDTYGNLLDLYTTPDGIAVLAHPPIPLAGPEPSFSAYEAAQLPTTILRQVDVGGITWRLAESGSPEGRCLEVSAHDEGGLLASDQLCTVFGNPSSDTFDFVQFEFTVRGSNYTVFTGRTGDDVAAVRIHLDPPITDSVVNQVWLTISTDDPPDIALVEALDENGNVLDSEEILLQQHGHD